MLWLPIAVGLAGFVWPRRAVAWLALTGSLATLGLAIALVAGFDTGAGSVRVSATTRLAISDPSGGMREGGAYHARGRRNPPA